MSNLMIISGVIHVSLSFLLFYIFYREKHFRRKQQIEGYSIYKIIPKKIIDILFNYYNKVSDSLRSSNDLKKYEKFYER
jgi:vacuolar-type H+-ATPase subunit I/STV1